MLKRLTSLAILATSLLLPACGGDVSRVGDNTAGTGGGGGGGGAGSSGGAGGQSTGGAGGVGGFVEGPVTPTNKIDLLLMIDNSLSMADKAQALKGSVPQLLDRLINPQIDPKTGKPEIKAITDLHIGVITSSLGGHGGDQCSPQHIDFNPTQIDNAHLLPSVREGLPSYSNLGFLWWAPTSGGETDNAKLASDLQAYVMAAGEIGCGYEAQLEAWYRFLVDPSPPKDVVVVNNNAEIQGVDAVVLEQRADFLRPDSAVVIVMLTDENDCSVVDGGFNWIATQTSNPNNQPFHLPRATSACQTDPDSPCCRSCSSGEAVPPAGCKDISSDPQCQMGPWDDKGDHPNLRCWDQKRRFGIDFLYPTRRYVEALTQPTICPTWDANGPVSCTSASGRVPNPLNLTRDPRLVFLTGIVGVPWQDLATSATLNDPTSLELKPAAELSWKWLVRDCKQQADTSALPRPIPMCAQWDLTDQPDDPLLIESPLPRQGTSPATGNALAPPTAAELANPINGHEWNTGEGDLQFACIFKLEAEKDCDMPSQGCDCQNPYLGNPAYSENNPLCQNGTSYSTIQRYAKAYPGLRHLEVLHDLGNQAIVASICPRSNPTTSTYGYNAAMAAVMRQIAPVLVK